MKTDIFNKVKNILHRRFVPVIIYIALLVAATINVSSRGGTFSYVFFYAVLLYLPLSFIYIIYIFLALKVYQETTGKLIQKGTAEDYQLVIENSGPIPISDITFYYNEDITHFPEDFTVESFRLLPREKVTVDAKIICRYAGSYDAGVEGYTVQDIFGILRFKKKVKIPIRVHVLPVITNVAENVIEKLMHDEKNGNLFSLRTPENHLGNDVRKYMEGDSLNRVHWKNYAKTRELYVRLPEKQESEMISMVLISELMDGTLDSIKLRDRYLEYLVSIAEYFGMKQKPLMIFYYYVGVKSYVIDSPETFHEFYTELLTKVGSKSAVGHEEEMLEEVSKKAGNIVIFREKDYDDNQ